MDELDIVGDRAEGAVVQVSNGRIQLPEFNYARIRHVGRIDPPPSDTIPRLKRSVWTLNEPEKFMNFCLMTKYPCIQV